MIACGRRQDVLDHATSVLPGLITHRCDVEQENERTALYEWIRAEYPETNVLINNAGIQNWMSPFDADFLQRAQQEIHINIEAIVHLTSLFAQSDKLNTVMNVSSGLSFVPLTKTPVYSATKAFVHSYTQSSRVLLASRGVEVIEIIPPALNTDLGGKGLHDHAPPVSDFIDAIFAQLAEGKQELTFGFSESVATGGPEQLRAAFQRLNGLSQN